MNIFGLLIVLVSYASMSNIRAIYKGQDEDKVLTALEALEKKKSLTADEQCYKAVFLCMKADYLTWPSDKLAAFKKGYKDLNTVIRNHPNNAEYKYHRYMIEKFTPSWLFPWSDIQCNLYSLPNSLSFYSGWFSFSWIRN